jgi:protein PhnA
MLRNVSTFVATALIATASFAAVTVGKPAPSFSGVDVISGKTITNESVKGKTVVMEWNNFGCPFVKKFYSVGAMQKFQEAAVKDDVVWVTVNSSAAGKEGHLKDAAEAKAATAQKDTVEVRDAVGNLLADGDQVTLIKDLTVKGAGQTLKRGTLIKSIRLTGDAQEIDCRFDGIKGLVLRAEFVRKR